MSEQQLLKTIQLEVPLVERPFEAIAQKLSATEREVMHAIHDLKQRGIIRSIAGIFNAKMLGYQSNLVAFKVPHNNIEQAVNVINPLPGVSHNYLREGDYNLWFTLSLPSNVDFLEFVKDCSAKAGSSSFNIFKATTMVKLSARFTEEDVIPPNDLQCTIKKNEAPKIDDTIKNVIKVLQQDLPIVSEPFLAIVTDKKIPLSVKEVLATGNLLLKTGVMRSYRAVVRHHAVGYIANAMTVWKSNSNLETILQHFSNEPAISHLYVREAFPNPWEYPIFAMVHAKSQEELASVIHKLHSIAGTDYRSYRSLQEFKKERVRYFEE